MSAIKAFLESLYAAPHYAFGWIVLACIAILPAIVSGNLVQHYLSKLTKGEITLATVSKSLLLNLVVLVLCVYIIAYALYLYVWN